MALTDLAFWFLAVLGITGAIGVVFARNAVFAALNMAMVMMTLGIHYVFLHASFLGAAQIIIYAGAVLVLFLYIAMLLEMKEDFEKQVGKIQRALTYAVSLSLIGLITLVVSRAGLVSFSPAAENLGHPVQLGEELLRYHVVSFELASVLLVAAIVGAVLLGKRSIES